MSRDELRAEQKKKVAQYVFWTAVAVIGGYLVLYVV